MDTATARPTVFVSYSRKDESWKDRLVKQLRVLELEGDLEVWDDRRIDAGADWLSEIEGPGCRAPGLRGFPDLQVHSRQGGPGDPPPPRE